MEKLLYLKLYEKTINMKETFTSLGKMALFICKDITNELGEIIDSKTVTRGFRVFLEPEVLIKFKSSFSYGKYSPKLDTLNIFSNYLGYDNFLTFCKKNTPEIEDTEEIKSKKNNNITVYQENNGKVFGDVYVKESINFNFKKNV